jgi:hypothetical protein
MSVPLPQILSAMYSWRREAFDAIDAGNFGRSHRHEPPYGPRPRGGNSSAAVGCRQFVAIAVPRRTDRRHRRDHGRHCRRSHVLGSRQIQQLSTLSAAVSSLLQGRRSWLTMEIAPPPANALSTYSELAELAFKKAEQFLFDECLLVTAPQSRHGFPHGTHFDLMRCLQTRGDECWLNIPGRERHARPSER